VQLPVNVPAGCPEIGSKVASRFGDVNCDQQITSVDALLIPRHVVSLLVSQNEPCRDIGESL
jgi:hypothetical protein